MFSIHASRSLWSISCPELKWQSPPDYSPLTWWILITRTPIRGYNAATTSKSAILEICPSAADAREPKKCLRSPENLRALVYSPKTNGTNDSIQSLDWWTSEFIGFFSRGYGGGITSRSMGNSKAAAPWNSPPQHGCSPKLHPWSSLPHLQAAPAKTLIHQCHCLHN